MPQQQTSLLNLLATGATELALNAPTTAPNLQFSQLKATFAATSDLDLNGVAPPTQNLQVSNLSTLLAQANTPNLDLGGVTPSSLNQQISNLEATFAATSDLDLNGVTPPKYIDNQPQ
jgi:hypothetical protein